MKMSPKAKRALQIVGVLYVFFIGVYIVEVWKYHGVRPVNDAKLAEGDYALKDELMLEGRDKPTLMYPPHSVIDQELVAKMKEYDVKEVKVEGNGPIIGVNATAVFIWRTTLDRIPRANPDLGTVGTRLRVVGVVHEYRGSLEIIPTLPYDVEVLSP